MDIEPCEFFFLSFSLFYPKLSHTGSLTFVWGSVGPTFSWVYGKPLVAQLVKNPSANAEDTRDTGSIIYTLILFIPPTVGR